MEKFQQLNEEAIKNYRIADHILNKTYPLLKDTRMLVGVTENIFLALTNAMSCLLHHERIFKLVPPFQEHFESKFLTFQNKSAKKHKIDKKYLDLLQDLKETMVLHQKSPIEFKRKDRFIICTDKYHMKAITFNQLKEDLKKTKEFLDIIQQITSKNERIFN